MSDREDLFGFGADPAEFKDRVACNCGSQAAGAPCAIDCATYTQRAKESNSHQKADDEGGSSVGQFYAATVAASKRQALESLDALLKAAGPAAHKRQVRQDIVDAARHRRKTFRITQYDPVSRTGAELVPWSHTDPETLRAELLLAYRLITVLVDKMPASGAVLSAEEVRRVKGLEPMFAELVMNFAKKDAAGQDALGLAVEVLPPNSYPI